jgi:hypothetical protein
VDQLGADHLEERLSGGAQTAGVVRIGDTVRYPAHPNSDFIDALLRHLETADFDGAPRTLGYDEQGRHVLSFIEGDVFHSPPYGLSDIQLLSAIALIRRYHDATAASFLRGGQEVVCHGDLGPHNIVFRGDLAVAIIDWDADVAPGRRADDFAHAVWCLADLIEPTVPLAEQSRRTALMCQAYPGMSPAVVVRELTARFVRARAQHERAGRTRAVEIFDGLIAWMSENGPQIACVT